MKKFDEICEEALNEKKKWKFPAIEFPFSIVANPVSFRLNRALTELKELSKLYKSNGEKEATKEIDDIIKYIRKNSEWDV